MKQSIALASFLIVFKLFSQETLLIGTSDQTLLSGSDYLSKGSVFAFNPIDKKIFTYHSFESSDLRGPIEGVVEIKGRLYGIAQDGGTKAGGGLFSISTNGSDYQILHEFQAIESPVGVVVQAEDKLFGLTVRTSESSYGAVYSINMDGSGFKFIKSFDKANGSYPSGLFKRNGKLWGFTSFGGEYDAGTIFSMGFDGSDFVLIHEFDGVNGKYPVGYELVEVDGFFYGVTKQGGNKNYGTVYSMKEDGSDFRILLELETLNAKFISGSPVLSNGKLWCVTASDVDNSAGLIFSLSLDGTEAEVIHRFTQQGLTSTNGFSPYGVLNDYDGRIWGTTWFGGANGYGNIFSLDNDGTDFKFESVLPKENANPFYTRLIPVLPKQPQRVGFSVPNNKKYGATSFNLIASSNTSNPITFSSSDDNIVEVVESTAFVKGAGEVAISANQNEDDQYEVGYTSAHLKVEKALLKVEAKNEEVYIGDEIPEFELIYTGFVNEEGVEVIDERPSASTSLSKTDIPGSYVIQVVGGEDNNYDFELSGGVLKVLNPLNVSINESEIYTNPVNQRFRLTHLYAGEIENVLVLNLEGKIVKSFDGKSLDYDVAGLINGVYIVAIKKDNLEVSFRKLIIDHSHLD